MSNKKLLDPGVAQAFFGRFSKLTDVQEKAIESIIQGRNIVVCSGTGSGKTEAALAPLVSRYGEQLKTSDSTVILYVAPTKALVNDLVKRLEEPLHYLDLRLGVRHGDRDNVRRRKKPPHVIITTPESLDVMLFRGEEALKTILAVVIDEAHLLYNTQRGVQLSILLERLRREFEIANMQFLALSATIARLEDIGTFFFGSDLNTDFLNFPPHRSIKARVRSGGFAELVGRLTGKGTRKMLAFANKRKDCETLAEMVSDQERLMGSVFTHYSSLSKAQREEIESSFAESETALCVATSTLELGIDIGDIDDVMFCGVPATTESFLQRIGRGNRRSNETKAVCFVGLDDQGPQWTMEILSLCRPYRRRYTGRAFD